MINRYAALFGGLGILFGLYTVWWHNEARRLETAFPQALATSLPSGATLRQQVADVDGFPFRLNVRLTEVKVGWGAGDWAETSSITGIFQPFNRDHLILHLDAPIRFSIEGATGAIDAERALASLVGYEGGEYQLDGDALNVTLDQPAIARIKAARLGFHVRRETAGPPPAYAFALSVKGLDPKDAATGRLAVILAQYGDVQKDGTLDLEIDEKDNVAHAGGRTLAPKDAEKLKQDF